LLSKPARGQSVRFRPHREAAITGMANEPVCPIEAVFYEDDVPGEWSSFIADNAGFSPVLSRAAQTHR
jgi:hypothetical protein